MWNIPLKRFSLVAILAISFILLYPYLSLAYEKEIKNLSSAMAESIANSGKKTIAVVDFTDLQGNITELGRFIAEELLVDLMTVAKGFEIIDRTHLKTILAEHKLSISGLVNPDTVKKLGQIAGVDAIVTGCVTPFGDSIRVSSKVIVTDTARVIAAGKGDIPKTKAIEELLARGIEEGEKITGTGTQLSAKPIKKPETLQKVEAKGFTFEIKGCKMSGGSVVCDLMITSNEQDRYLGLSARGYYLYDYYPSRIFDDFGNEYIAGQSHLADKRGEEWAESLLVADVPTRASLHFEGVSQEATKITLLGIVGSLGGYKGEKFTVQFRNIPLTK